jgi:DNA-binding transcriptional ArsR family regulator
VKGVREAIGKYYTKYETHRRKTGTYMNNSEILIYKNPAGDIKIDVRLEEETVWHTQDQMATLFGKGLNIAALIKNSKGKGRLSDPEIKEVHGGIEVTLFNHHPAENSERLRNDFGMISERLRNDFGKDIALAFNVILKHPEYSSQQIANEIGKTSRTVENYLAKLKDAGIIVRKGPKLGGRWEIIEKP